MFFSCLIFQSSCLYFILPPVSINIMFFLFSDIINDESAMASIEIECCLNKVEKLVEIFKDFDIYISSVDYMDYHY